METTKAPVSIEQKRSVLRTVARAADPRKPYFALGKESWAWLTIPVRITKKWCAYMDKFRAQEAAKAAALAPEIALADELARARRAHATQLVVCVLMLSIIAGAALTHHYFFAIAALVCLPPVVVRLAAIALIVAQRELSQRIGWREFLARRDVFRRLFLSF